MYNTQKCSSNSRRRRCLLLIHYDMEIDLDEVVTITSVLSHAKHFVSCTLRGSLTEKI